MPNLTPGDLHVDRYLTNISEMFVQEEDRFVGDRAFPVVPVNKASDLFVQFKKEFFWRDEYKVRPLGGKAEVASYEVTSGSYSVEEYALAHKIDDRVRANADDPIDPDRAAVRLLTQQAMVHRDKRWASKFFVAANWTTEKVGTADTDFIQWQKTTSVPVLNIDQFSDEMDALTALRPNIMVLGADVWRQIRSNSDIREIIKYTQTGIPTMDLIASFFGLDAIIIARGLETTSKEGQATQTLGRIVNAQDGLLLHAPRVPAIETPSAGYTFAWTGLIPGASNAFGGVVQRGRDVLSHSDWIELRMAFVHKLVAADLGIYMTDMVA
jgi:hypothetical protein